MLLIFMAVAVICYIKTKADALLILIGLLAIAWELHRINYDMKK